MKNLVSWIRPSKSRFPRLFQEDVSEQRPEMAIRLSAFLQLRQGTMYLWRCKCRLMQKFREYLLNAKQLKHSNRPISLNSASGYYSTFRGLLKIAYRDKWFRENINDYLDKIEPQDVKKEYLTLNEVKQLAATPCDIPVLKAASLFACLTGLRISDILNLQWEDFTIAPDQGYCLRIRTQKTQTEATLPISYEAYELCGTPGTGKVFKDLKRSMINYPLKSWLKRQE